MPSDQEPTGFRNYKVSADARKQAQTLGIRGDVETRVARMARHAARFTHPMVNRHLFGWHDVDLETHLTEGLMGMLVEEMVCNRDSKLAVGDLDSFDLPANCKLVLRAFERPSQGRNSP